MAHRSTVIGEHRAADDNASPPSYTAAASQPPVTQPVSAHAPQPWRRDNWPFADTLITPDQLEASTRPPAGHQPASTGKSVPSTKQSWFRRCAEVLLDVGTGIACLLACLVMVPLALVANVIIAVISTVLGIICRPFLMCYMRCAD